MEGLTILSGIPKWHYAMLNDEARNQAFARGIAEAVRPGDRVVDIGAGTGLLSLLAARSGAATVDAIEGNQQMADVASHVISRNFLGERITLHREMSSDMTFPPDDRRNVLIAEIFDCGVVGEGVLPSLRAARRTLLEEHYIAVPHRVTLRGSLIAAPRVRELNEVGTACGVDVRLLNRLQTRGHFPVRLRTWPHRFASRAEDIYRLDLTQEPPPDSDWQVTFVADTHSVCDGVCAWFEMEVTESVSLSSYPDLRSHWMQAFIPFEKPVLVRPGERVAVGFEIEDDERIVAASVTREMQYSHPVFRRGMAVR